MRQKFLGFLIAVLILAPLQASYVGAAYNQTAAKDYLLAHANNPWSTMALAALGTANIPSDHLKSVSGSAAIDFAAPVLAITALKQDPRTFGNQDLVAKLKSYHQNNQIGDQATINDDIFGLLALLSSGEPGSDAVVTNVKNFILNNQNQNGGWGFQVGGGSDSNMTAGAIVALKAAGVSAGDSKIQSALNYLKTAQNTDGGFTYDPTSQYGTASDSSSTSWVLWALNALSIDQSTWAKNGQTPVAYLEGNQAASGYFKYQSSSNEDAFSTVTTAYAVIALSGKTLPIHTIGSTSSGFDFRIEGKDNTVCVGKANGPTALDVVKNAAGTCGFTYSIKDTSFGPYLEKINNDQAAGLIGWIYLINWVSKDVGANDYQMKPGDELLWFYGDFNWKPSRLTVTPTQVQSGQPAIAKVEYYANGSWSALEAANVLAGTQTVATNNSGNANLALTDGFYKVFAQKDGYIRSNSVGVTFGQGASQTVSMKVNVVAGQVGGDSIAFTVNPSSVDFGTLKPGEVSNKDVIVKNTGQTNITLKTQVSGDSVFTDNMKVAGSSWSTFTDAITKGSEKSETLSLGLSQNYNGTSGEKNGMIVFWASAQ